MTSVNESPTAFADAVWKILNEQTRFRCEKFVLIYENGETELRTNLIGFRGPECFWVGYVENASPKAVADYFVQCFLHVEDI